jgi:hypothetical protein
MGRRPTKASQHTLIELGGALLIRPRKGKGALAKRTAESRSRPLSYRLAPLAPMQVAP